MSASRIKGITENILSIRKKAKKIKNFVEKCGRGTLVI